VRRPHTSAPRGAEPRIRSSIYWETEAMKLVPPVRGSCNYCWPLRFFLPSNTSNPVERDFSVSPISDLFDYRLRPLLPGACAHIPPPCPPAFNGRWTSGSALACTSSGLRWKIRPKTSAEQLNALLEAPVVPPRVVAGDATRETSSLFSPPVAITPTWTVGPMNHRMDGIRRNE